MKHALKLAVFLFLSACAGWNKPIVQTSDYMPSPVAELAWGMGRETVLAQRNAHDAEDSFNTFRAVYIEEPVNQRIESIVYYFDADLPGEPLYEVIITYKDPSYRDAEAASLLGEPNAPEGEWHFSGNPAIRARKHQNKLVVIALIPGTEWNP